MPPAAIEWNREWTVEGAELPLKQHDLFPRRGKSKFKLVERTQGNRIVSYTLEAGPGMNPIWNGLELKPLGSQHLKGQTPRLPKRPGGGHKVSAYIEKAKQVERTATVETRQLLGTMKVQRVDHKVTFLQAVAQLKGDEGDEPMLIIRVEGPQDGRDNPDGSAVGHF